MSKKGWKATVLRASLYEEIETLIRPEKERALPTSVAGFIDVAVREKIERSRPKREG
jgi:hypothetical protein